MKLGSSLELVGLDVAEFLWNYVKVYHDSESKVSDVEKVDFFMSIFKVVPLIDHSIYMTKIILRLKLNN